MRTIVAYALLLGVAVAGTEAGKKMLEHGDYAGARKELTLAAREGDAEAQFQLGEIYRRGLGVSPAASLAAKWYRLACDQGHGGAAGELGILAWKSKKRNEAIPLLNEGAKVEYARALYLLGMVPQGEDDAGVEDPRRWEFFRRAAEVGHPDAQSMYAAALESGKVKAESAEEERFKEAEEWYRKAAAQGHPGAHGGVGDCELRKDGKPGPSSNIGAGKRALKWYRQAALLGHYQSQHFLALAYLKQQDLAESYAWMVIASSPKNSWPARHPIVKKLYKDLADILKDAKKRARRYTNPGQEKAGKRLAKEYLKEIKANLKLGLPWEQFDT